MNRSFGVFFIAAIFSSLSSYSTAQTNDGSKAPPKIARLACVAAVSGVPVPQPPVDAQTWAEFRPAMVKSQLALSGFAQDPHAGEMWNKLENKPNDVKDGLFDPEIENTTKTYRILSETAESAVLRVLAAIERESAGKSLSDKKTLIQAQLAELKAQREIVARDEASSAQMLDNASNLQSRLLARSDAIAKGETPERFPELDFRFLVTMLSRAADQSLRATALDAQIEAVEALLNPKFDINRPF